MKKFAAVLTFLNIIAIFCLLLAYGPYKGFREFLITTAMTTKSHQYLAKVLYSDEEIERVMKENYVVEVGGETNPDEIDPDVKEPDEIDNPTPQGPEAEILSREPNQLFKIIEIERKGYHAYLTVIYDPSRLTTAKSRFYGTNGQHLSVMAKENNAIVAINGGGFYDADEHGNGSNAGGVFIHNGKIIEDCGGTVDQVIGITESNVLVLGHMTAKQAISKGIRDAVSFGPFLIINGDSSRIIGNGGYGTQPRTAIGQRKDGIILFLTVDGNGSKYGIRGGATMADLVEIFEEYGAYNAANLDGGASSVLAINGVVRNHPVAWSATGERSLPNAWIVK